MLIQFYAILYETSVCAYVMARRYGYALDKILKFCFCFLFCEPKLSHDSWGPQGFWGSGENGYLFSGSWGALVIISGDLGSKLIFLGI